MASASHRDELRAEFARYGEMFRQRERQVLTETLQRYGIDATEVPPVVWAVFATSLSRILVMETALGMSTGHAETLEFVEAWLRQLEGEPAEAAAAVTTAYRAPPRPGRIEQSAPFGPCAVLTTTPSTASTQWKFGIALESLWMPVVTIAHE